MIWWIILGLFWPVLFGLFGAVIAQQKGFYPAKAVLFAILLSFFSPLMYFAKPERKKCGFCKEWMILDATVCPHCQREQINCDLEKHGKLKWTEIAKLHEILGFVILISFLVGIFWSANEQVNNMSLCKNKGVEHYKAIGSYPFFSDGASADEGIYKSCQQDLNFFGRVE